MSLPSFPAQDLAKLVLGYLVEEQLMTAYDEFLQASPYLDAFTNEYDRLCMISLKNILAEYRAMRMFVESCKPAVLRKKLLQCANLYEMLKYLIHNVDIKKVIDYEPSTEKNCSTKLYRSVPTSISTNMCQQNKTVVQSPPKETPIRLDVETTSLSDLPGNTDVRSSEKAASIVPNTIVTCSESHIQTSHHCEKQTPVCNYTSPVTIPITSNVIPPDGATDVPLSLNHGKGVSLTGSFQEFTTGAAGNFNSTAIPVNVNNQQTPIVLSKNNVSDNASRVSTPSVNIKIPLKNINSKGTPPSYLLKGPNTNKVVPHQLKKQESSNIDEGKIKIISDVKVDHSILNKELLDSYENSQPVVPPVAPLVVPPVVLAAAQSSLMQMQSIYVNGTPAYKQNIRKYAFTKDEIMSMPTLILVKTSAPPHIPIETVKTVQSKILPENNCSLMNPLTIDVQAKKRPRNYLSIDLTDEDATYEKIITECNSQKLLLQTADTANTTSLPNDKQSVMGKTSDLQTTDTTKTATLPKNTQSVIGKTCFLQTADMSKNASLPKDTQCMIGKTSTPHSTRPVRKSSSTPRRSSHVRVLDFTTPRRILNESTSENDPDSIETIVNKSFNVNLETNKEIKPTVPIEKENNAYKHDRSKGLSDIINPMKENDNGNVQSVKKKNWDADLRVLAVAGQSISVDEHSTQPKKEAGKKKKKPPENKDNIKEGCSKNKNSKNSKSTKRSSKSTRDRSNKKATSKSGNSSKVATDTTNFPIKPIINIIAEKKGGAETLTTSKVDKQTHTPEMEQDALQNAIGAKLNISDFLETPYKQALYDIQMDTPRFLAPDLGEPVSDIKIMNIPTPRFLNTPSMSLTPKPGAITPSSYCSRPTDYSSGGSYYKPDDHDYAPLPEDLEPNVNITPTNQENKLSNIKTASNMSSSKTEDKEKAKMKQTRRPVRQCAKNVSYYNTTVNNKNRDDSNDKLLSEASDIDSHCTIENELRKEEEIAPQSPKLESKKKSNSAVKSTKKPSLKRSTPKISSKPKGKEMSPKHLMENKHRKVENLSGNITKSVSRKKSTSKDKYANSSPLVISAPTKSRRKSSTPRKLHCTKTLHADKIKLNNSSETVNSNTVTTKLSVGSQDCATQNTKEQSNEIEDISKIKEFIEESMHITENVVENVKLHIVHESTGHLHMDLIKRGFDIETAKSIERDLLDTPPLSKPLNSTETIISTVNIEKQITIDHKKVIEVTKTTNDIELKNIIEGKDDKAVHNDSKINDDDEIEEDFEFSAYDCDELSPNYIKITHSEIENTERNEEPVRLKDTFCMEVCIEDMTIRLSANSLTTLFSYECSIVDVNKEIQEESELLEVDQEETDAAVNSITSIDKLYTPIKERTAGQVQCLNVFDSSLTSLDTPLKPSSPRVTEMVLEVETCEGKQIADKKRKKRESDSVSDGPEGESKKYKSQYITTIQNFDIESLLSKLHGP